MGRGRPGSHTGQELPAGRGARHAGPGRPFRRLMRHPVAAVLLCGGLLAAGRRPGRPDPADGAGGSPRDQPAAGRAPGARRRPGRWSHRPGHRACARVARPVYLSIPVIGVHTRLIRLGLTAQGTLQVPASTSVAGWYTGGPRPGQVGSAVIAGHIDSYLGPGVFFRLRLLRPGDRVYVRQAGGSAGGVPRLRRALLPQGPLPHPAGLRARARPRAAPDHLRRDVRPGGRART